MRNAAQDIDRNANYGTATFPAPTAGWNAKANLANMDPLYAIEMVNMFPEEQKISVRPGFVNFSKTKGIFNFLLEWNSGSTRKLIAAKDDSVYAFDTSGNFIVLGTGFTSDKWQGTNFQGRMFLVNGVDDPQTYDGTTLSSSGWTSLEVGFDAKKLNNVITYNHRLYFTEEGTANFWYAGTELITGNLSIFPLSMIGQTGGFIMCEATWSPNTGNEIKRFIVFVMSTGEVIVYAGADPEASDWSLVGLFKIGQPLSKRGITNYGSDLAILTKQGIIPLSKIIQSDVYKPEYSLSDNIDPALRIITAQNFQFFGWEVQYFPQKNKMIVNIPMGNGIFEQYVMNTLIGSWCRQTGINAVTFAEFNEGLYFSGIQNASIWNIATWNVDYWEESGIYQGETGFNDIGSPIIGYFKQAYNNMGVIGKNKKLNLIKTTSKIDSLFKENVYIDVDFNGTYPFIGEVLGINNAQTLWNVATWNVDYWVTARSYVSKAISANILGNYFSLEIETRTQDNKFEYYSTDYSLTESGIL